MSSRRVGLAAASLRLLHTVCSYSIGMFSRLPFFESFSCNSASGALARVGGAVRQALWTGEVFSAPAQGVWETGFAGLNAELPSGGWPGGGLIEVLQDEGQAASRVEPSSSGYMQQPWGAPGEGAVGGLAQRWIQRWASRPGGESAEAPGGEWEGGDDGGPGAASPLARGAGGRPGGGHALGVDSAVVPGAEWRLLLPALARLPGGVTLIGPPAVPHAAALAQAGVALDELVWVRADTPARRLWAAEQVLRAGLDGATLVWLPWASAVQLRRLQMAALASPGLVFVMRPASVAAQSSPAPLRLLLRCPRHDTLAVRVFKRRGPPAEREVELTAWPPGLDEIVAGQGWMTRHLRQAWSRTLPQAGEDRQDRHDQPALSQAAPALAAGAATLPAASLSAAAATDQPQERSHVVAGLASA